MSSCCRYIFEQRTLAVSKNDILTVEDTCCLLKEKIKKPEKWLRNNNLVALIDGVEFVVWGEALDLVKKKRKVQGRSTKGRNRPQPTRRF
jgi:hypothetical protein